MLRTLSRLAVLGFLLVAALGVVHADGPTPPCWPCCGTPPGPCN